MRTVKEISELTGISVRTLHYYDEIGLLKPTKKSDAGYRLYDDRALEILQQILFFREFDIPLKEIKAVLENPALERNQILQMQRKMLVAKKERMEHLIASIDDILKGENKMDFAIFSKTEVEEMFQTMFEHMPDNMKELAVKEFGSIEEWKKHYIKTVSSEEMQKGYAKVVDAARSKRPSRRPALWWVRSSCSISTAAQISARARRAWRSPCLCPTRRRKFPLRKWSAWSRRSSAT